MKAKLHSEGRYQSWLQEHKPLATWSGLGLIGSSLLLWTLKDGIALGILGFLLLSMAGPILVISLAPLRYFRVKHIMIILAFSLLSELFIFY
ncbi:hypothetical protein [Chitinophaga caeni]|uniref:hypothetical protein n=1 Tax=Chitinophaga caeni TaxID=2029983 RepID=UPI0012FDB19F|nr:hypothetical protein [Chitinophaga caeni]